MDSPISLTAFVALWGASLSTFVVVRDWWRARTKVRVSVGYTALATSKLPGQSPFVLATTISNHGKDTLYLAQLGPQTDRGMTGRGSTFLDSPPLPHELRPGQSYTAYMSADELWNISSYGSEHCVRMIYYDQLGREYKSRFIGTGQAIRTADSGWSFHPVDVSASVLAQWTRRRRIPQVT
jgi:hypothetical protein